MCRFIETIRVIDGVVMALPYHQSRVDRTLQSEGEPGASLCLLDVLSDFPSLGGEYKARIVYDTFGRVTDQGCSPYTVRPVASMQLVEDNTVDYRFKREDRSSLLRLSAQKGSADEVIIVRRGLLTDTSYSNIALFDGERWFTPKSPLLNGTMRSRLLDEGKLVEADLAVADLSRFSKVSLINAMMPLGRCVVDVAHIRML